MALSGVPRAFEIFDETLDAEVRAELESFAGNKIRRETYGINHIRSHNQYRIMAPLHGESDLCCFVGYRMRGSDGYPVAVAKLETRPGAVGRDASVEVMKRMATHESWEGSNLDDPSEWAGALRLISIASLLSEEDHVAAVKRFFIESIHQLRDELTAFKKENPDLPWNG